ncbi:MAG TPA: NAD(P)-dependent oxidoreductase [Bacteroidia bacterium]|nr:NAD(P)-dependent oxidoreductase [Bacteroidia bacterium]
MKKILITGASGFIGSALAEEAVKRNYEVYAGIRSTSSRIFLEELGAKILEMNLADAASLERFLFDLKYSAGDFDYIIHNAGITKAKKEEDFYTVNYRYTKNLVSALTESNFILKKFIYMSSLAALGPGVGSAPIHETNSPQPITAYGRSKLLSEKLLTAQSDLPFLIIRPTAVYGPRDRDLLMLIKILNRKIEPYIGFKKQMLSFVYIRDLAKAVFATMESSHTLCSYNVGDGNDYTLRSFNEAVKKHLSRKTFRITIPATVARPMAFLSESFSKLSGTASAFNRERLKEYQAKNWLCDTSALKDDLQFRPDYTLENGLQETIDWYRKNKWL